MKYYVMCVGVALLLAGCANSNTPKPSYDYTAAMDARNKAFASKIMEHESANTDEKDRVVNDLIFGMRTFLNGDHQTSTQYFSQAELAIEENYTKSISNGVASMIDDDNALTYSGELYEDVYINAFNALNYMEMDDLNAALVESRRMAFKLRQMQDRIMAESEAFEKFNDPAYSWIADIELDTEAGKIQVQASPFSHYLSSIIFAKTGKPDDARIEYNKFLAAYDAHQTYFGGLPNDEVKNDPITDPGEYNVVFVGLSGLTPRKTERKENTYIPLVNFNLPYAYAVLDKTPSQVQSIEVSVNGQSFSLPIIEEFGDVASQVYESKQGIVKMKALLRGAGKGLLSKVAADKASEYGGAYIGMAAQLIGDAVADASEDADVRGWNNLPEKVHSKTMNLDPGEYTVTYAYKDQFGNTLFSQKKNLMVSEGQPLELVQSAYLK